MYNVLIRIMPDQPVNQPVIPKTGYTNNMGLDLLYDVRHWIERILRASSALYAR